MKYFISGMFTRLRIDPPGKYGTRQCGSRLSRRSAGLRICLLLPAAVIPAIHEMPAYAHTAGSAPGPAITTVSSPPDSSPAVNYLAMINRMARTGVNPKLNAARTLIPIWWRAMGMEKLVRQFKNGRNRYTLVPNTVLQKMLSRELGLPAGAPPGPKFLPLYDTLMCDQIPANTALGNAAAAALTGKRNYYLRESFTAESHPWSAHRRPWLAQWLRMNRAALNAAEHAITLPRFYTPILPRDKLGLLSGVMPQLTGAVNMAGAMAVRAMLRLHEGNLSGCTHDLLSIHRLARLIAQEPMLNSEIAAFHIEHTALRGDRALARTGWIPYPRIQAFRRQLGALPPIPGMERSICIGQRYKTLDVLQRLANPVVRKALDTGAYQIISPAAPWTEANSKLAMRLTNVIFDRLKNAVFSVHCLRCRQRALENIWPGMRTLILQSGRRGRVVLRLNIGVGSLFKLAASTVAQFRMAQIALALAAYRAKHAWYPDSLRALRPGYFRMLPRDPYTGKTFTYAVTARGCALFSPGQFPRAIAANQYNRKQPGLKVTLRLRPGIFHSPARYR